MNLVINKLSIPQDVPEWQRVLAQVELLLIQGGFKLASKIYIQSDGPQIIDVLNSLAKNLSAAGFYCRVNDDSDQEEYSISVGKNDTVLDELERCLSGSLPMSEADLIHGRLSGFPDSAITAFINGELIEPENLPEDIRKSPEYTFAAFRLSKDHWKQELEVGKKWATYVKSNAPDLYQEYLEHFSE